MDDTPSCHYCRRPGLKRLLTRQGHTEKQRLTKEDRRLSVITVCPVPNLTFPFDIRFLRCGSLKEQDNQRQQLFNVFSLLPHLHSPIENHSIHPPIVQIFFFIPDQHSKINKAMFQSSNFDAPASPAITVSNAPRARKPLPNGRPPLPSLRPATGTLHTRPGRRPLPSSAPVISGTNSTVRNNRPTKTKTELAHERRKRTEGREGMIATQPCATCDRPGKVCRVLRSDPYSACGRCTTDKKST